MGRQTREAEDVLAYWHAVEMFDPRDIPRLAEAAGRKPGERYVEQVRFASAGSAPPLPWEPGHPRSGEPPATGRFGSEWRHFVYGGLFGYRTVRDEFATVLGYEPGPDYGGIQRDSHSAMFAFAVDQRGCLIDGASAFSSCMWAVGRLHRPGPGEPGWLEGFAKSARESDRTLARMLASRSRRPGYDEGHPAQQEKPEPAGRGEGERDAGDGESPRGVRAEDVVEFSKAMAKELALPEGIADHCAIRIVSTPVFRRKDGRLADPEPVILSSLIVPDLQRVQEAGEDGFGAALSSYLGEPLKRSERVDLAADRAALLDGVRPSAFPLARWPADTASALTTSQQFAVNTIMARLGGRRGRGLFAVNGPPGTGKTTLLRDLIAAIITARAAALAGLKEPGDAFAKDGSVWRPNSELTGFEIVVASSNNAAVENVTTELPTLNAIGDEWHGLANYLGEQAVAYLGPDAWGTIAVPLGKFENRLRFRDKLWFADGGLYQFLRARARERNGILGAGAQDEAWSTAVQAFKKARRDASRLTAILRKQESLDGNAGLGGVGPERWAELSQEEQELAAPWSDEEWTRARTDVFLAALDLHAAFVAGAADPLLHNMERMLRVLGGDPDAKKSEDLRALWQTLFLIVPVISTTFASCGRMFGALGRESLGWLLIDEAGQALPQAAVGALWRSRRAVVVGDPMQLRPISRYRRKCRSGCGGCSARSAETALLPGGSRRRCPPRHWQTGGTGGAR
ncbi:MAG TPA: AAA domain-containing protein [Trebonia sp.]